MDDRNGSPYDRGGADAYYGREMEPHYFEGESYKSKRIEMKDMTSEQVSEYVAGYLECNERKN